MSTPEEKGKRRRRFAQKRKAAECERSAHRSCSRRNHNLRESRQGYWNQHLSWEEKMFSLDFVFIVKLIGTLILFAAVVQSICSLFSSKGEKSKDLFQHNGKDLFQYDDGSSIDLSQYDHLPFEMSR